MSEMNQNILIENVRDLLKRENMTQQRFAEIVGMTQANVSKALNPDDKRCFTLEQVYRISKYFRVSIDELTGNTVAEKASTSPRAVLAFLVELLKTDKARVTSWVNENEEVFDVFYDGHVPSCSHIYLDIEYPAIYFPSHFEFDGTLDYETEEAQTVAFESYDEELTMNLISKTAPSRIIAEYV